jgi:integrase
VERGRYAPQELVFATVHGTPLHESNFNRRVWRPALERAGLADAGYRFHDLRHTCVSRLVAAGADVKLVRAVAGHSSPLITLKRHAHLLDARVGEAADRFDPGAGSLAIR